MANRRPLRGAFIIPPPQGAVTDFYDSEGLATPPNSCESPFANPGSSVCATDVRRSPDSRFASAFSSRVGVVLRHRALGEQNDSLAGGMGNRRVARLPRRRHGQSRKQAGAQPGRADASQRALPAANSAANSASIRLSRSRTACLWSARVCRQSKHTDPGMGSPVGSPCSSW